MNLTLKRSWCIFRMLFFIFTPDSFISCLLKLAAQFDDVTGAALHNIWVVGEFSAAVSGSVKGGKFEWKPVWVGTAALLFGINTDFGWAIVDSVPVSERVFQAWVELDTGEEDLEHLHDEKVFDDAGSLGAIVESVGSGARFSEGVSVVVVIWVGGYQTES